MIKKLFLKFYLYILLLIFTTLVFIFAPKTIFADEACYPYNCLGTGTTQVVDLCVPVDNSINCLNNEGTVHSINYTCPTGGGAGSCTKTVANVNTCGGYAFQSLTGYDCTCVGYSPGNTTCQSGGNTSGESCNPYGNNVCSCEPVYDGICVGDRSKTLGCCLITGDPPPPPPPPPTGPYCGDGTCNGTDNCANCSTDCGECTPPPTGPYCGDGTCNNGETNCDCGIDCTGTCPGGTPFCSVSLSPSTVNLNTDDNPFNITANVSNIQNGTVNQVEFNKSNSNVNMNPVFDNNGTPWQSLIDPVAAGTTTLTANVYMGGGTPICSATATVNISVDTSASDEAPDCESFVVSNPSVQSGDNAHFVVEITDDGLNIINDNSFESGTVSFWPTTNNVSEWWAVDSIDWPSGGIDGRYYAKIKRANSSDPHVATDWIQTGENLTGQEYTYTFLGKSHGITNTVHNLLLQREPYAGDWTGTGAFVWPAPEFIHTEWQKFRYDLTFPNPGNGSNTTRLRAVLRPPQNDWPVYYDKVKVFKTSTAGVMPGTVNFYARHESSDPCGATSWIHLGVGQQIGTSNFYELTWDTTDMEPGDYIVRISVRDVQNNLASGNPYNCAVPGVTYRLACNGIQTITSGGTCSTPQAPTNFKVNNADNNTNIDLTSNDDLNFTWTASTIAPPSNIAQYEVRIWDQSKGTNPNSFTCNDANKCKSYFVNAADVSLTRNANYIHGNNIYAAVRAISDCTPPINSSWSSVRTHDLVAQVSGNIYDRSDPPNANNNCTGGGTPIDISGYYQNMISSTGGNVTEQPGDSYIMSNVPFAPTSDWFPDNDFSLELNIDTSGGFTCSCPNGCTQTDTQSPSTNQDFFVTSTILSNGPWWQAREGNVYGSSGYTSPIPDTCEGADGCSANLIRRNTDSDEKSAGIPISGGIIDANGYYTEYDNSSNQPHAQYTSHANVVREDYDYFSKNIDLGNVSQISSPISAIPNNGTVYGDAQLFYRNGDLTMDLSAQQNVTSGTKKIIFVNGNVTITGATATFLINVAEGGYFAIIASGNITIANSIGNVCSYPDGCINMVTNLDGVYIASNQLIIADDGNNATKDNIFIGRGTFVGWNGIKLNRSFNNNANVLDAAINNEDPTNIFRFRPDFTKNTPEILRSPNLVWQEVN